MTIDEFQMPAADSRTHDQPRLHRRGYDGIVADAVTGRLICSAWAPPARGEQFAAASRLLPWQRPEGILSSVIRTSGSRTFRGWTRGPGPVCLAEDVLDGFTSGRGVSGELRARRARALVSRGLERATGVRERTTRRPA